MEASNTCQSAPPSEIPLLDPLRRQIDWLQRRHRLTPTVASLAALLPVLCAVGRSRRILNPLDLTFLPPQLNLVLFGSPVLHIQSAVNLVLDPIRQWIRQRTTDTRRIRLRIAELHEELIQQDFLLRSAVQPSIPGIDPCLATAKGLSARREEIEAKRQDILRRINEEGFRIRPFLLSDDAPLRRLLEPGQLSHDAAVLATSVTGHAVTAWTQSPRSEKAQLARLLVLGSEGFPDAGDDHGIKQLSNVVVTTPIGANTMLYDKELAATGVNSQFLFVPSLCPDAATNLYAECAEEIAGEWTTVLQDLITARVTGGVVDHQLTPDAVARFQGFLASNKAGEEIEARAPALCLKLALLAHCASLREEERIGVDVLEYAIVLATAVCGFNQSFVDQHALAATNDDEVDALVARVRVRGPLRWRQLLRGRRIQKSDPLIRLLGQAVETGRLRREGELYYAQ